MVTETQIRQAKEVDLVHLVENDLGPGKRSGRWVMFVCPFHADHDPSLAVRNKDDINRRPFWQCHGCGKMGDAIGWLRQYRGMGFSEAVKALEEGGDLAPVERREPVYREPAQPPGEAWQKRAWQLIERAQACLWEAKEAIEWPVIDPDTGEEKRERLTALEWLLARGLDPETIKFWQLGYIPTNCEDKPERWGLQGKAVGLVRGILIPCMVNNKVWYLKTRRPQLRQKYSQVRGSRPAIYLVQSLEWHTDAVFCEGEMDALALWQEAGDVAGVATLGSAGADLDIPTWGLYLLGIRRWFLAYDMDPSGQAGADKLAWLKSSRRLQVPQLREKDKDLTDFARSGGDLRQWLSAELAKA